MFSLKKSSKKSETSTPDTAPSSTSNPTTSTPTQSGFFSRLKQSLAKTRQKFANSFSFLRKKAISPELF